MKNENTRPTAATVNRASENQQAANRRASTSNDTMNGVHRQTCISCYLAAGEQNAKHLIELCSATGLDGRTVRSMIAKERLAGECIISSERGYYLANSEREIWRFVRSMRSRAGEILRAAAAVEKAGENFD